MSATTLPQAPHSYAVDPTPLNVPTPPTSHEVEDVLPPNVLKVAVPIVLVFLGLSYVMAVGTVCYRLIYVTIHLDGSAAGLQLATPDLQTISTVIWTTAAVFCVVVVGTQVAGKLLALFGK